jgi:hypothetical protein
MTYGNAVKIAHDMPLFIRHIDRPNDLAIVRGERIIPVFITGFFHRSFNNEPDSCFHPIVVNSANDLPHASASSTLIETDGWEVVGIRSITIDADVQKGI